MNKGFFHLELYLAQLTVRGVLIGLPICEDIWSETVVECLCETGAEIILSINASPYSIKKRDQRMSVAVSRVIESKLPLIYLNRVGGQDELVFDGSSFCLSHEGNLTSQLMTLKKKLQKLTRENRITIGFVKGKLIQFQIN